MLNPFSLNCKAIGLVWMSLAIFIQTPAQNNSTEIIWDNYGVPHVYGRNIQEMYYAFGWAQMNNHANLLLRLYGQARGRAAEYWGDDYFASDKQVLLFDLPEKAKGHYAKQDTHSKQYLDAFVDGINAFAEAHPEIIDASMKRALPVTPTDVIAHSSRVICLEFLAREDLRNAKQAVTPGSNAYAIAPSRSASKNALLLANPHLPWSDLFLFFEAHLNAPDFSAYGASLVGQPVLNIAFNDNLGWTHTVNTIDGADRYELRLQDDGYVLDGAIQKFARRTVLLKIRRTDGTVETRSEELLASKHGPVIGIKDGKAYAVRVAGLDNAFISTQFHKMAQARNLKEFESALQMLQLPMFNVIYADKTGNILYLFNGNVPKRSQGDWSFWSKTVDGTSSKYIWDQYHAYEELPKVLNPVTGFIQNANDPPWTCTYPAVLEPRRFPSYMAPQFVSLRPQRAINLIKDDMAINFDELAGYKLNTGMEAADRFLDDLLAAIQQHPHPEAEKGLSVLKRWDGTTDPESKGAILFAKWFDKMDEGMFLKPWNPAQPITTPNGLKNPEKAVDLFVQAISEVNKMYGALDISWGEINRFKKGNYNYPGNGGPSAYGIFRVINYSKSESDRNSFAAAGDSYVAIIEFGPKVKAKTLLSYGNASQPGNKHVGDQLELLSQKVLRPALLDKNEIVENAEKREHMTIPNKH